MGGRRRRSVSQAKRRLQGALWELPAVQIRVAQLVPREVGDGTVASVSGAWRSGFASAAFWRLLTRNECASARETGALFGRELLRNNRFACETYDDELFFDESFLRPEAWATSRIIGSSPWADMECEPQWHRDANERPCCVSGALGVGSCRQTVPLNESALGPSPLAAVATYEKRHGEEVNFYSFSADFLDRRPALLLTVWVAGAAEYQSAFKLSLSLVGNERETLGGCTTRAKFAPNNAWRQFKVLVDPPTGLCAVHVNLLAKGLTRFDGELYCDCCSGYVGPKFAAASLRFCPAIQADGLRASLAKLDDPRDASVPAWTDVCPDDRYAPPDVTIDVDLPFFDENRLQDLWPQLADTLQARADDRDHDDDYDPELEDFDAACSQDVAFDRALLAPDGLTGSVSDPLPPALRTLVAWERDPRVAMERDLPPPPPPPPP